MNVDERPLKVSFYGEGGVVVGLGSILVVEGEGGAEETVVDNQDFSLSNETTFFFVPSKLGSSTVFEIVYTVEDVVSGLSDAANIVVTVVGGDGGGSDVNVNLILMIAIPTFVVIVLILCSREYWMQRKIDELEKNLILALAYSSAEVAMIEEQIETFRGVYKMTKGGSGDGDGLEKLLIKRKEIESQEMIGKGR